MPAPDRSRLVQALSRLSVALAEAGNVVRHFGHRSAAENRDARARQYPFGTRPEDSPPRGSEPPASV